MQLHAASASDRRWTQGRISSEKPSLAYFCSFYFILCISSNSWGGWFSSAKKETKGGKKGSREVHCCEWATDHKWAQARKWHKAAYFTGAGEGSTRFCKHHRVQEALPDLCHRAGAETGEQEPRGRSWGGRGADDAGSTQEKAPRPGEQLSVGFRISCATKPVKIACAPAAQLCCWPTMKTGKNMKHLHPQLSPW